MNLNLAFSTTVLLVDDDIQHLELRALMKTHRFSVITVAGPPEAISIMNQSHLPKINLAVVDYHMPVMNGCILAEYLKARYPELKVLLYSGALEIQEDEMPAVDAFVSKSEGIVAVVAEIAKFAQVWPANSAFLAIENNARSGAVH
jgi:CheY-like chemotaxis protein